MKQKETGILLAISSLPSRHGIGDFGPRAYQFIDLLEENGLDLWQILPLNPLGYGNSPYQPYSSKAIDEIYISLTQLQRDKLLPKRIATFHPKSVRVDYTEVRMFKLPYLRKAYEKFIKENRRGFKAFKKRNPWVYNYALFITFKKHNYDALWLYWPIEFKDYPLHKNLDLSYFEEEIEFNMWLQFIAYKQWQKLHRYAKKHGINLVGDIPIYVGIDSVDVWENRDTFLLDKNGFPTHVAGVPPDYFSKTGQRWGNPLYDWEYLEKTNFAFWKDRLGYNSKLFDVIRIDHFRAFDTYWKIPADCPTAEVGEWILAPGYKLFDELLKTYPDLKIVAEDLGDLREEVLVLRDHYDLPGMEIVQFAYEIGEDSSIKYPKTNRLVYTGTHDNQTLKGWFTSFPLKKQLEIIEDLANRGFTYEDPMDSFLAYTLSSTARIAIFPLQDVLGLDDRARFNTPGTIGRPNWEWKLKNFTQTKKRLAFLGELNKKYRKE
ncbi:MAG: 4-alpha-glucanotransferase [Bacilli bacterium]|jgi:4-alpha-glucanotransferase